MLGERVLFLWLIRVIGQNRSFSCWNPVFLFSRGLGACTPRKFFQNVTKDWLKLHFLRPQLIKRQIQQYSI